MCIRDRAILGSGECGATGYSQAPELIFIFTAVERRGAGFASALIERCEHYLSALGYDSYVARTAINVSPETLRFYRRHGFACSRRTGEGGQFFAGKVPEYAKKVTTGPRCCVFCDAGAWGQRHHKARLAGLEYGHSQGPS